MHCSSTIPARATRGTTVRRRTAGSHRPSSSHIPRCCGGTYTVRIEAENRRRQRSFGTVCRAGSPVWAWKSRLQVQAGAQDRLGRRGPAALCRCESRERLRDRQFRTRLFIGVPAGRRLWRTRASSAWRVRLSRKRPSRCRGRNTSASGEVLQGWAPARRPVTHPRRVAGLHEIGCATDRRRRHGGPALEYLQSADARRRCGYALLRWVGGHHLRRRDTARE